MDMAYNLAINKNGELFIGVMEEKYSDFIDPILREMDDIRSDYEMGSCEFEGCKGCPDCTLPINFGADFYD